MLRIRSARFGIIAGLVVIVLAIATYRSGLFGSRADAAAVSARLMAEGQRQYRQIELAPIASARSPADIVDILMGALGGRERLDPDIQLIVEASAEFLYYRFGQDSPAAYVQWREDRGERLKPASVLRTLWMIDADHQALFDAPYPGDDEIVQIFDRFWEMGTTIKPGSAITAVAAESPGVCVRAARMLPSDAWPLLECDLTSELWHGYIVSSKRNWWQGSTSVEELRRKLPHLDTIVVGIIARVDNGDIFPWHLTWYYDPSARCWVLYSVTTGNVNDPGSSLEY